MRLFSIIQWHHFAYMIIALALLGYGISGTLISIFQIGVTKKYRAIYTFCLLSFSVSTVLCFYLAQEVSFNAEEVLWNKVQLAKLTVIFIALSIPFTFSATAICLTFMQYRSNIPAVYAVNLCNAAIGSLLILAALFFLSPKSTLLIIGLASLAATLIAQFELKSSIRPHLYMSLFSIAILLLLFSYFLELNISPYKHLSQSLRIHGTQIIKTLSSPLGTIHVVKNESVPFRHAPGVSLAINQIPPEQLAIFVDADNMSVINKFTGNKDEISYLDQSSPALPYHLSNKPKKALIIGAGGGADVLQAIFHDTPSIDALEINPQISKLTTDTYADFSGNLYKKNNVNIYNIDARDYLATTEKQYDLIQISLLDSFGGSTSGLYALNENYLYTVEALKLFIDRLTDEGYLTLTRWIKLPPRDTLKLFATAVSSLKESGVNTPELHLILIRGWQTSTLLVKKKPLLASEIESTSRFSNQRLFDIAYMPSIKISDTNRYNVLSQPHFYLAAKALLSDNNEHFIANYKFNIAPATDERPYYNHFFKWATLKEILQLVGKGGTPLLEWGYLVLCATLVVACMASVILILLPLSKGRRLQHLNIGSLTVFTYFIAIGCGFMFIEIAFIQKFILFLKQPIYSASAAIAAFLVFAGFGSALSEKLCKSFPRSRLILLVAVIIACINLAYLKLLTPIFSELITASLFVKFLATILLIAPLAFFMGLPFPLALSVLARHAQPLIPWSWAVNGCASVVSTVLALLLAIHIGYNTVIILAVLLYCIAALAFPKPAQ